MGTESQHHLHLGRVEQRLVNGQGCGVSTPQQPGSKEKGIQEGSRGSQSLQSPPAPPAAYFL